MSRSLFKVNILPSTRKPSSYYQSSLTIATVTWRIISTLFPDVVHGLYNGWAWMTSSHFFDTNYDPAKYYVLPPTLYVLNAAAAAITKPHAVEYLIQWPIGWKWRILVSCIPPVMPLAPTGVGLSKFWKAMYCEKTRWWGYKTGEISAPPPLIWDPPVPPLDVGP